MVWAAFRKTPKTSPPRYWNAAGVAEQINRNRSRIAQMSTAGEMPPADAYLAGKADAPLWLPETIRSWWVNERKGTLPDDGIERWHRDFAALTPRPARRPLEAVHEVTVGDGDRLTVHTRLFEGIDDGTPVVLFAVLEASRRWVNDSSTTVIKQLIASAGLPGDRDTSWVRLEQDSLWGDVLWPKVHLSDETPDFSMGRDWFSVRGERLALDSLRRIIGQNLEVYPAGRYTPANVRQRVMATAAQDDLAVPPTPVVDDPRNLLGMRDDLRLIDRELDAQRETTQDTAALQASAGLLVERLDEVEDRYRRELQNPRRGLRQASDEPAEGTIPAVSLQLPLLDRADAPVLARHRRSTALISFSYDEDVEVPTGADDAFDVLLNLREGISRYDRSSSSPAEQEIAKILTSAEQYASTQLRSTDRFRRQFLSPKHQSFARDGQIVERYLQQLRPLTSVEVSDRYHHRLRDLLANDRRTPAPGSQAFLYDEINDLLVTTHDDIADPPVPGAMQTRGQSKPRRLSRTVTMEWPMRHTSHDLTQPGFQITCDSYGQHPSVLWIATSTGTVAPLPRIPDSGITWGYQGGGPGAAIQLITATLLEAAGVEMDTEEGEQLRRALREDVETVVTQTPSEEPLMVETRNALSPHVAL